MNNNYHRMSRRVIYKLFLDLIWHFSMRFLVQLNPIKLFFENVLFSQRSAFSYAKLSKFLVHGFGDNSNITKLHEVKNALFERNVILITFIILWWSKNWIFVLCKILKENMNLFLVDWGQGAGISRYTIFLFW